MLSVRTYTPGEEITPDIPARAKFFLCASYALAAWAWRSWEFIVALVLIELYPDSLLMVSAYGLMDNLARVLLGPAVGSYLDRHERLQGAHAMLRLQNLCIGGSATAALVLLWPGSTAKAVKVLYWSLMWLLAILGAASSSGSTGVSISVEREAVKVLCGVDSRALAALNSVMRAIDLTALLCAPLVAGVLMTIAGPFLAVAVMAAYCAIAYSPEVLLLRGAFRAAPVLGQPKVRGAGGGGGSTGDVAAVDVDADADEHTGLLTEYSNVANDVDASAATVKIVEGRGADARLGQYPGNPAEEGTLAGAVQGDAQAQGRLSRHVPEPSSRDDHDENTMHRSGSSRLYQPLLLDTAESLPTSISASCLESGDGEDAFGRQAMTPGRSPSTRWQRLPGPASKRSGLAGGSGGLSTSSTMVELEVAVRATGSGCESISPADMGVDAEESGARRLHGVWQAVARQLELYFDSWRVYWGQPLLLPCMALALLYMTVLSLGFLMTSYLKWSGLTEAEVSGYRGIGALTGLAATAIFPPLSARAGLRFCAIAGVTYQLVCLSAGVLPVVAATMTGGGNKKPSVAHVRIMVAGLVSSRTGLWLYDLAVTQLIQEDVRNDVLGSVYAVQSSLQAFFEMLSFVAGLAIPDPVHFHWLMLGSIGSVASAAVLVWAYTFLRPGRSTGGPSGNGA